MKKILSVILACAMVMSIFLAVPVAAADAVSITSAGTTIEAEDLFDSLETYEVGVSERKIQDRAANSGGKGLYFVSKGLSAEKTGAHVDISADLNVVDSGPYTFELVAWYYGTTPKIYIDNKLVPHTQTSADAPWASGCTNKYKLKTVLAAGNHTLKVEFYEGDNSIDGGNYRVVFHADCINVAYVEGKSAETLNVTGSTVVEAEDFMHYICETGIKAESGYPQKATSTNSTSGITFTQVKYDSAATDGTGSPDVYVDFTFPVIVTTAGTYSADIYGWYYGLENCKLLVNGVEVEKSTTAYNAVYWSLGSKVSTKNAVELDEGYNTITLRIFEYPVNKQIVFYLNHMDITLVKAAVKDVVVGKTTGAKRIELENYVDRILNPFSLTKPVITDLAGSVGDDGYICTEKLLTVDSSPYFPAHDPEKYIGIELPVVAENKGVYNISFIAQTYEQHTEVYVNDVYIGRTDYARNATADTRTGRNAVAGKYTIPAVLDAGENTIKLIWHDRPVGNGSYNIYFRADYVEVDYVKDYVTLGTDSAATEIELEAWMDATRSEKSKFTTGTHGFQAKEDSRARGGAFLYVACSSTHAGYDSAYYADTVIPVDVTEAGYYKFDLSTYPLSESFTTNNFALLVDGNIVADFTRNDICNLGDPFGSAANSEIYCCSAYLDEDVTEVTVRYYDRKSGDSYNVAQWADYLDITKVGDGNYVSLSNGKAKVVLDEMYSGYAVIALYGANNELVGYGLMNNSQKFVDAEINITCTGTPVEAKAYVWKDLEATVAPLVAPIDLVIK